MIWGKNMTRCWLVVGCFLVRPIGPASAEDAPAQSHADQLFEEALVLMKADHCPDAVPRLVESHRLDPSSATLLNLGTCYERMGRTGSAWRTYKEALAAAIVERDQEYRTRAEKALELLEPTLTRLRVLAPTRPDGLIIKVNGDPVGGNPVEVPLDPGDNFVEAVAPGHQAWRRTVNAQRQGMTVVIELPEMLPVREAIRAPATLASTPRSGSKRSEFRTTATAAGGLGVIGVAYGMFMGLRAKSAYDKSTGYCNDYHCLPAAHEWRETAYDRAAVAAWATLIGVAALGTGAALWLISDANRVGVTPWLGPERAGVGLTMEGGL